MAVLNQSQSETNTPNLAVFNAWFGLTITVSITGTVILLLLLTSWLGQSSLRAGSQLLLLPNHMSMQLLNCGVFYPNQNISIYRAKTQQHSSVNCPLLSLLIHHHVQGQMGVRAAGCQPLCSDPTDAALSKFPLETSLLITLVLPWVIGLSSVVPFPLEAAKSMSRSMDCVL